MTADKILDMARSQIGIFEYPSNSNRVKYNTEYYGQEVSGSSYPWCCVFVWWVFRKCGASNLFFGGDKTASCTTLMKWYKSVGKIVTTPKPGDIVFYQFDNDDYADHVGIVESVDKDTITAIEGNTSESGSQSNGGQVLRKIRKKTLVMAYARPGYEEDASAPGTPGVYNTLEEVPSWSYHTIKMLVDRGLLKGDETGLNLSYDLLRTLVILDRAGVFKE